MIYDKGNPRDWIFKNSRGNRLIWFTDLYELIKKYNINLRELIDMAEGWGIHNIIYYNLYILNKLYPIPALENLPKPKLSRPKKIIYNIVLKKARFRLHHDIHLRPIRAVDLVNYLFPPLDYYCRTNPIPGMIIHILTGLREILKEFLGICYLKLSTNKKKESCAVN